MHVSSSPSTVRSRAVTRASILARRDATGGALAAAAAAAGAAVGAAAVGGADAAGVVRGSSLCGVAVWLDCHTNTHIQKKYTLKYTIHKHKHP